MNSITIIVPAYNEEKNLEGVVLSLIETLNGLKSRWKIIIVNDASTDDTELVANKLSSENEEVTVLHNKENINLGGSYKRALGFVETELVSWIPGDGEIPSDIFLEVIPYASQDTIVTTYPINSFQARSLFRYTLSKIYRTAMNLLFGLNVRYQNGTSVIPTKVLKEKELLSEGFTINLEILIRAFRSNLEVIEVPFSLEKRGYGESSAISFRRLYFLTKTLVKLFISNVKGDT